jgi:hypothetical protein
MPMEIGGIECPLLVEARDVELYAWIGSSLDGSSATQCA